MCGFTGIWRSSGLISGDREKIEIGTRRLQHRGPDARGLVYLPTFIAGHTRLSIVDLDPRSNQPMSTADGRFHLVFNGEIYNHRSLAQSHLHGVTLHTSSDTEVLLYLLAAHGSDAVKLLSGCFAFAFFDALEQRLILARDQSGINPLIYTHLTNGIAFSSELRALAVDRQPEVDVAAIASYLSLSYLPQGSPFLGIYALSPGHFIDTNIGTDEQPWYALKETFSPSMEVMHVRDALECAVQDRLLADVEVGTFLSGGIDSAIVTALAAAHQPGIRSFTIGFPDTPYIDEHQRAEATAQHIGTRHTTVQLSNSDLVAATTNFLHHLDQPFADSSAIAVGMLSEATAAHVKVALSGDGADELFGGYRKHRAHALTHQYNLLWMKLLQPIGTIADNSSRTGPISDRWRKLLRLIEGAHLPPAERYLVWSSFVAAQRIATLFPHAPLVEKYHTLPDELNAVLLNDQLRVLPFDMLTKVDMMSMKHSLEVRVPFLDKRVIASANALPSERKFNNKTGKIPLRSSFTDLLPASVFNAPKRGFEVPINILINNDLNYLKESITSSTFLRNLGMTSDALIQVSSGRDTQLQWHLIVLHHWLSNTQHHPVVK